jgi:ankyrin repeat protein
MIDAGVDISAGDYDGRTALHLAASEGQVKATELLLTNGANVNAADRFGNTPLQDAERGKGKNYRLVVQQLLEEGAVSGTSNDRFVGAPLQTSMKVSLPLLCQDGLWDFAEAWFPTTDGLEFISNGNVHYGKSVVTSFDPSQTLDIRSNSTKSVMGRCYESKKPEIISSVNEHDFGSYHDDAAKAGMYNVSCIMYHVSPIATVRQD